MPRSYAGTQILWRLSHNAVQSRHNTAPRHAHTRGRSNWRREHDFPPQFTKREAFALRDEHRLRWNPGSHFAERI